VPRAARSTPLLQPPSEGLGDCSTRRGLKKSEGDFSGFPRCYQQFGIYTSALHHYPSRSQLFKALMQTTCRTRPSPRPRWAGRDGKSNKQSSCLQSPAPHIFHALWASPEAASCLKKNTCPKLSICLT